MDKDLRARFAYNNEYTKSLIQSLRRLDKKNPGLKVPHMGWNEVRVQNKNELFENLVTNARFYHVHSYKVVCADSRDITAVCHYGEDFTCAVSRGNIYGVQFHPEKSHKFGVQFFKNFLRLVKND